MRTLRLYAVRTLGALSSSFLASFGVALFVAVSSFLFARALARNPKLLVLDDPFAGLDAVCREHGTTFIMKIGGALPVSGKPHDGRAPDYDDWALNGDLLVYNAVLEDAFEISSMGIRVDGESLKKQLALADCTQRLKYPYHKMIAENKLPLTIGGGIGQSRLCMLMLGKAHIGEVQSSLWPEGMRETA